MNKKINIFKNQHPNQNNISELTKQVIQLDIDKQEINKIISDLKKELQIYMYNVIDDIIDKYQKLGYTTHINELNTADYGGFTTRKRLFIVAIRNDIKLPWKWPEKTHSKSGEENLPYWRTVKDAFNLLDLNGINNIKNDKDNIPMKHKSSTIGKFKKTNGIGNNNNVNNFSSRGSTKRLSYNKPAFTLVPGHSSFPIHPTEHRSITVREGAVISGFPINYHFVGNHTMRCMQIGDAIPVHLSIALAKTVKNFLKKINCIVKDTNF
jgi:DNA (cytosine-5)-methyltransferase 1